MPSGSVRNLEQIQENDGEAKLSKGATIGLLSLGGACIVFAALAFGGKREAKDTKKVDPLGELVQAHGKGGTPGSKPQDLSPHDVTFPGILSDDGSPTTALAAVKSQGSAAAMTAAAPPPAGDRLPVVPLPAQNVLEATPIVTRPRDALTRAATEGAQLTPASIVANDDKGNTDAKASADAKADRPAMSPAGREGGYQLQVSSFRTQAEADQFATQLRARTHKAYVVEAHVPGRGTWYRVRIGPFTSHHAAAQYRSGFEGREHVVPFIVPPAQK